MIVQRAKKGSKYPLELSSNSTQQPSTPFTALLFLLHLRQQDKAHLWSMLVTETCLIIIKRKKVPKRSGQVVLEQWRETLNDVEKDMAFERDI